MVRRPGRRNLCHFWRRLCLSGASDSRLPSREWNSRRSYLHRFKLCDSIRRDNKRISQQFKGAEGGIILPSGEFYFLIADPWLVHLDDRMRNIWRNVEKSRQCPAGDSLSLLCDLFWDLFRLRGQVVQ
jgi:hypothetical protein